ncbi:MAG: hypothetical protein WKG32_02670 [Gemmatimonadaceae bacterium]
MKLPLQGLILAGPVLALWLGGAQSTQGGVPQRAQSWTEEFALDSGELTSTGRNPYFVLEPGYRLVLEDGAERLTITVLAETRMVKGVETRVVEERETKAGTPVEVSRNYFAISRRTNSVFYFGEDVDIYSNGKVTSHEGGWLAGTKGARPGLMMPGLPLLNARYYQELAPGVAMDRAQIVSFSDSRTTPAGTFAKVLRVEETSPLEPGHKESKLYARGVGLLQDGSLTLVRYGADTTR